MSLFDDVANSVDAVEDLLTEDDVLSEPSDLDIALDMYERLASGGDDEFMIFTVIPGVPPSKSRPRFRRSTGTTYTPTKDRYAEAETAAHLRSVVDAPLTGNVALACVFYRPDRQRIDTDNMLKHVCDAANGILWVDDSQVTAILGLTERDHEHPRTILVVANHVSTMGRGTDDVIECKVCGTEVPYSPRRVTCSRACSMKARGAEILDQLVPCPQCDHSFKRRTRAQKYCSAGCSRDALRDRRKNRTRSLSRCLDCDVELTHFRGGRCRDCWRAHVTKGGTG